ncbi:hypothetical protein E2C01_030404 [Portunus trituberculatus]|uniref:Uncharacterized protein n=1 Tax=Portunus trituberculatus TaxID=210409 RepID=A0A5B7EU64_PORTR|nr:hypothetical protein [Portunus trituberculatus]
MAATQGTSGQIYDFCLKLPREPWRRFLLRPPSSPQSLEGKGRVLETNLLSKAADHRTGEAQEGVKSAMVGVCEEGNGGGDGRRWEGIGEMGGDGMEGEVEGKVTEGREEEKEEEEEEEKEEEEEEEEGEEDEEEEEEEEKEEDEEEEEEEGIDLTDEGDGQDEEA